MSGNAHHASLATEAALLLDVVAEKLEPIVAAGREQPAEPDPPQPADEHRPCTSCPICVLITVVKSDNGDINRKLAEGALLMVNALRGMIADSTDSKAKPAGPTADSATQSPPANPVLHIDID